MGRSHRPVATGNKQEDIEPAEKKKEEGGTNKSKEGGEGEEEGKLEKAVESGEGGEEKKENEKNVVEGGAIANAAEDKKVAETVDAGEEKAVDAEDKKVAGEKKTAANEEKKAVAPPHQMKDLSREMMYKQRPPPFPPHPHNGHPGMEPDMYPYPPPHMFPPYGIPPGYGMRPNSSNYRPHPPYNEQGFPHYHAAPEQGVADGATPKTTDKQGIPQRQRGFPPGYWPPREGFPPGYGPRPEHEMGAPHNEQGFPPGYSPWPRHHGYPPPMGE